MYRFTWISNTEIANLLHRTGGAVTMSRTRIGRRLTGDPELTRRITGIEEHLRAIGKLPEYKGYGF